MAVLEEELVAVVVETMTPLILKGGRSVITATLLSRFRSWSQCLRSVHTQMRNKGYS